MEIALFTGGVAPPIEYTWLELCEVYQCTPSQLFEQEWRIVRLHLKFLEARRRVKEHRDKHQAARAKKRAPKKSRR